MLKLISLFITFCLIVLKGINWIDWTWFQVFLPVIVAYGVIEFYNAFSNIQKQRKKQRLLTEFSNKLKERDDKL
jgi:hypothetical protein